VARHDGCAGIDPTVRDNWNASVVCSRLWKAVGALVLSTLLPLPR